MILAHRLAWEYAYGPIPDGLQVLHRCDNPPCINPEHLWLGTNVDNMADRQRKGRTAHTCGSRAGNAKLTEDDIPAIILMRGTQKQIAEVFGVSRSLIGAILQRKVWPHVFRAMDRLWHALPIAERQKWLAVVDAETEQLKRIKAGGM
jgi:hypothetical protein